MIEMYLGLVSSESRGIQPGSGEISGGEPKPHKNVRSTDMKGSVFGG